MIGSERFFKPSNLCSLENSLWVQCFSFPRIVLIGLDPAYIFTSSKAPFTQALQKHTCSLTHMLLNSSSIFTGSMHHSFQEAAQRNIFTKYMSASGGISPSHSVTEMNFIVLSWLPTYLFVFDNYKKLYFSSHHLLYKTFFLSTLTVSLSSSFNFS